jgi:hypothetical protein
MDRDLILFLQHTDHHIIEEIKKTNPHWVSSDGACRECVDYYRRQFSGR